MFFSKPNPLVLHFVQAELRKGLNAFFIKFFCCIKAAVGTFFISIKFQTIFYIKRLWGIRQYLERTHLHVIRKYIFRRIWMEGKGSKKRIS